MNCGTKLHAILFCLSVMSRTIQARNDVTTTHGKVVGFKKYVDGKLVVDTFYGIPYAKPPIRELRFMPPEDRIPWTGEKSAKFLPNSCLQLVGRPEQDSTLSDQADLFSPPTRVSENCLYLNLWVPRKTSKQALSTLVWFHGGAFTLGSAFSPVTDGAYFAEKHGVIIASVNYRLGVAGFLYTGRERFDARGNMGLLDQRMALKWLYNNVNRFGGNREDITLFGEEAGAASIGLHLLSPKSWPFFSRAILQSGSPLSGWALTSAEDLLRHSQELAALAGCQNSNTEVLVRCLQDLSAADLLQAQREFSERHSQKGTNCFIPVMDRDFLGDELDLLLKAGKAKPTSILIGVNEYDGVQTLISQLRGHSETNVSAIHITKKTFIGDVIPAYLATSSPVQSRIVELLYNDMAAPNQKPNSYNHASVSLVSDLLFRCDVISFAEAYLAKGDVFVYSFRYGNLAENLITGSSALKYKEVDLLFGLPFRKSDQYSQEEMILSNKMMELWSNFAKFGSPNALQTAEVWPVYDSDSQRFLVMDTLQGLITQAGFRRAQCLFLKEILPLMKASDSRNQCPINWAEERITQLGDRDAAWVKQAGSVTKSQADWCWIFGVYLAGKWLSSFFLPAFI